MKTCARCGREIPESAADCSHCGDAVTAPAAQAVAAVEPSVVPPAAPAAVAAAPAPTPVPAPASAPAPGTPAATPAPAAVTAAAAPARAGLHRRAQIALLLIGTVGGAVTLAMLMASGSSPAVTPAKAPVATRKPVQPAAAAVAAPAAAPKWKSANSEWLWNPRKGAAFELRAENKVAIWQGLAQPTIVVRCESNKMVAFVYTASAIQMEAQDSNHTVRLSFDDEPEATERWADSSDHDALFAPDGPAFVQRLTNARTLKFGYTPHNASRAVAEFQVSGLSETILPAAKQCGLKK